MTKPFYLGLDIETSGIDYDNPLNLILEVGFAVCFLDRPEVYGGTYLVDHRVVTGEPKAIEMAEENGILQRLREGEADGNKMEFLIDWLVKEVKLATGFLLNGTATKVPLLGKNLFAFDIPFLRARTPWKELYLDHRALDPAMFYMYPSDRFPPGLKTCSFRAGIETEVAHTAYADVIHTIKLVHHHFEVGPIKEVSAAEFEEIVRKG